MGWFVVALATTLLLTLLVVRARRRRAARRARRERTAQRLANRAVSLGGDSGPTALAVEVAGDRLRFVVGDEGSALELPSDRAAAADADGLLEGVVYLLRRRAAPHDEALVLRLQGRDLAPLVVRDAWLAAFPTDEPVPSTPLGNTGLSAVYRLTSPDGLRFLTARCLAATGIAKRDLHAAVEAMLRQGLDETAVRRAVSGGEIVVLEDGEDRSAAYLFVVADELGASRADDASPPSLELLAAVATAGRMALGPPEAGEELRRWLEAEGEALADETRTVPSPLARELLRITPSGADLAARQAVED